MKSYRAREQHFFTVQTPRLHLRNQACSSLQCTAAKTVTITVLVWSRMDSNQLPKKYHSMTVEEYLMEKNRESIDRLRSRTQEDIAVLRETAEDMKKKLIAQSWIAHYIGHCIHFVAHQV